MATVDKPNSSYAPAPEGRRGCSFLDLALRSLIFATTLVSVLAMVFSNETKLIPYPLNPKIRVPRTAKYRHSPAFTYFVGALSLACLYSLITLLISFCLCCKRGNKAKSLLHFAYLDVIMLGLVASATGAAAGVAYIGLRGNSHVNWGKICNVYHSFCGHLGVSIALALAASFLLLVLILHSIHKIHRKNNRYKSTRTNSVF